MDPLLEITPYLTREEHAMSTENDTKTGAQMPCRRCDGCGQLANSDDREPWSSWLALPVGSAMAVTMGLVKPEPCDECGGTGKAATQPAGKHHTGTGNPTCPLAPHHHLMETCDCGYQYEYPAPDTEHRPIGVRSTDVGAFIRCSCGSNPTPHYWLRAHWPGDKAEGERLLQELAREIGGH